MSHGYRCIKEELFVDFDLGHAADIPKLIQEYIVYFNFNRPAYSLDYMTPAQKFLKYRKKVPTCELSTYENEFFKRLEYLID